MVSINELVEIKITRVQEITLRGMETILRIPPMVDVPADQLF